MLVMTSSHAKQLRCPATPNYKYPELDTTCDASLFVRLTLGAPSAPAAKVVPEQADLA
jgi:hypothetical protein